jgi:hypothetical protein
MPHIGQVDQSNGLDVNTWYDINAGYSRGRCQVYIENPGAETVSVLTRINANQTNGAEQIQTSELDVHDELFCPGQIKFTRTGGSAKVFIKVG